MEYYAMDRSALRAARRGPTFTSCAARRSLVSLLVLTLFSARAFRVYKAVAVCVGVLFLLGLIGGMESGNIPLWVGAPLCLLGLGSAAYKFF